MVRLPKLFNTGWAEKPKWESKLKTKQKHTFCTLLCLKTCWMSALKGEGLTSAVFEGWVSHSRQITGQQRYLCLSIHKFIHKQAAEIWNIVHKKASELVHNKPSHDWDRQRWQNMLLRLHQQTTAENGKVLLKSILSRISCSLKGKTQAYFQKKKKNQEFGSLATRIKLWKINMLKVR